MSFKEYYKCYFLVIKEDMKNKKKKLYPIDFNIYFKIDYPKKGEKNIYFKMLARF